GRGPDACIDAVGLESHGHGPLYALDRAKQLAMLQPDRPLALRQAIRYCKNGGDVSVIGVYGGFIDKFPMGAVVNRSLTIRACQCPVQRCMRLLLEHLERGDIGPSFGMAHRLPLMDASLGYDIFTRKQVYCEKVVLTTA